MTDNGAHNKMPHGVRKDDSSDSPNCGINAISAINLIRVRERPTHSYWALHSHSHLFIIAWLALWPCGQETAMESRGAEGAN